MIYICWYILNLSKAASKYRHWQICVNVFLKRIVIQWFPKQAGPPQEWVLLGFQEDYAKSSKSSNGRKKHIPNITYLEYIRIKNWKIFVFVWAVLMEYHRLGYLNSKYLFLHSSGNLNSKISVPKWSISWWGLSSWFTNGHLLALFSHGRERYPISLHLFIRALILSRGLHSHEEPNVTLITSQRPHLQMPSHRELKFQHINFERILTFSS